MKDVSVDTFYVTNSANARQPWKWIRDQGWKMTAGTLIVSFLAFLAVKPFSQSTFIAADDLAQLAAALMGAVACSRVADVSSGRNRRGWTLLGAGALVWALGQATYCYYELLLHVEAPYPSLADVAFTMANFLFGLGLMSWLSTERHRLFRLGLDSLIIAGAFMQLLATTVLDHTTNQHHPSLSATVISTLYPTSEATLVALVVLFAVYANAAQRSVLKWIAAALTVLLVTDLAYDVMQLHGIYDTGSLIDVGWPACFLMITIAARNRTAMNVNWSGPKRTGLRHNALPLVPASAALALAAYECIERDLTSLQQFVVAVVVILTLVRQFINTIDLERSRHHLRLSEERLQLLISSNTELVGVIDRSLHYSYLSPAAKYLFGRSPERLLGASVMQSSHPDDRERLARVLGELAATPGASAGPVRHRIMSLKRRGYAWFETTAVNRFDEPSIDGIVFHTHDVSEQEAARQQLHEARDRAIQLSEMKSTFIATVSHEIRNPIHGVLGLAESLLTTSLQPDQYALTSDIVKSATGLRAILNDILDLTKIEAGKLEIEQSAFDLQTLVESVATNMRPLALEKSLHFEISVDGAMSPAVVGDELRVRQILVNLISNAIKFTNEGFVSLHVRQTTEGMTLFSVSDSGVGIPAERIPFIFESFVQAESSTSRKFGGSGLGLTICAELAKLMDGRIDVQSIFGRGTEFTFVLPLAPAPHGVKQPIAASMTALLRSAHPDFTGIRVLLAEDNDINQQVVRHALSQTGAQLTVVANGIDCVRTYEQSAFDIVLMDCEMPEMDGFATTRAIRIVEQTTRRRTPIIALTANAMTTHQQHCIEAGMDTHLAKPFLRDELFAAIAGGLGIANAAIEIRPHDNDDYDGMLLDAAIVMDLIEDGLFADLLRSFDSQSAARLQALSDAYAANTPTSVAAMAHRLRSPAATMGFAALTTTCAKLEYAANAGVLLDARHLDSVRALTRASSAAAQEFIRLQTLHPNPR